MYDIIHYELRPIILLCIREYPLQKCHKKYVPQSLFPLQKTIEQMQQKIAMLTNIATQKEQAIATLMTLQNMGVTESEIVNMGSLFVKQTNGQKNSGGNGSNSNNPGNSGYNNGSSNKTNEFKLDNKLRYASWLEY